MLARFVHDWQIRYARKLCTKHDWIFSTISNPAQCTVKLCSNLKKRNLSVRLNKSAIRVQFKWVQLNCTLGVNSPEHQLKNPSHHRNSRIHLNHNMTDKNRPYRMKNSRFHNSISILGRHTGLFLFQPFEDESSLLKNETKNRWKIA